jgi:hypothetical protein
VATSRSESLDFYRVKEWQKYVAQVLQKNCYATRFRYVTPDSERSRRTYVSASAGGEMEVFEPRLPADREIKRKIAIERHRKGAGTSDLDVGVPVTSMADIAGEEIEISSKPRWERNESCFCGSEIPVHLCHGTAIY